MNKKVALITGASKGIGAETAILLSKQYSIIAHYNTDKEQVEKVAGKIRAAGGEATTVQADLSTEEGCNTLHAEATSQTDALEVLVNNAGALLETKAVDSFDWAHLERTFAVNVYSAFMMSKLCIPLLHKGDRPCIIFLTSIAMRHGAPRAVVYGAAKGAIDSFTRGAAAHLGPKIRVNAVSPGVIDTPFHSKVTSPEKMKDFAEKTPLKALGKAEDVASTIEFLVKNPFITGETIDINGGLFMR